MRVCGAGSHSVQGEIRFAELLAEMGAEVSYGDDWVEVKRPADQSLHGITRDLNDIPDSAMTLATSGTGWLYQACRCSAVHCCV